MSIDQKVRTFENFIYFLSLYGAVSHYLNFINDNSYILSYLMHYKFNSQITILLLKFKNQLAEYDMSYIDPLQSVLH